MAAALCLVAGACGLRVSSSAERCATSAAAGRGCGGGGSGTGGVAAGDQANADLSVASAGDVGGAGAGGSGSSAGGAGGATATGATGSGGGGTGGAFGAAPTGGNGGSTDVGVTGNSITVANVSDLSGPVPGLFQGGPYGTQAYFDYVNSQGGVFGRQLKLNTVDDALACNQNEAAYQSQVDKVFGFVGSWSLDDSCGAQIMNQHANIPLVQQALSVQFQNLPNEYSVSPYNDGAPTGYFQYFKDKYPDAIGRLGTLVGNQPSAVHSWNNYKKVAFSMGYGSQKYYEDDFPPAQSNFTADVFAMRSQNIKMVFIIAVNAPDLANFSAEAAQQGWKPQVFAAPVGYFGGYVSESGGASAVEGQYIPVVQARFLGEDAGAIPEVSTFGQWMKRDYSGFPVDQFTSTSWAQAALFVKALQLAGPHLTRQGVLAALATIHNFDDNGMMAPAADIASKKAGHCYLLLQLHSGHYDKVDDPPTGYRCDGIFQPV